jgi:hypothetical protein
VLSNVAADRSPALAQFTPHQCVSHATEQGHLLTLACVKWAAGAPRRHCYAHRDEVDPHDITWSRFTLLRRRKVTAPGKKRLEPRRIGRHPLLDQDTNTSIVHIADSHRHNPRAVDKPTQVVAELVEEHPTRRFGERRRDLEGRHARVGSSGIDRAHVFDRDTVDMADLGEKCRQSDLVGKTDHQLVDGTATASFEYFDANDIAARITNSTCNLAKRTRAIGQPNSDDKESHGVNVASQRSGAVTTL